ncbi:unnamed protein product [Brachionus calyciflorus]|uniref:Laminin subunit beta-1 n=1 Tax=Brachionus calyciflorus TaxID=104777 RepID=A0A813WQB9_9BILA|nr:unnamed protein product [Brachionus calyciflorus]
MFKKIFFLLCFMTIWLSCFINCQFQSSNKNRAASCSRGDCYPETGDLLIGRTKFLHASSTCGLNKPERYCVLGTTRDPAKCFVCHSTDPFNLEKNSNSHLIENIVSRKQGDRFNRWWQSENGRQNVFIQFDLEAEFAFTHIIMTFKTFRPAAMIIEKSSDYGRTWKTYGYFASNCQESFPGISTDMPKNLGDVYCESKYSSETPSTKGEVVFRILPPTLIQSKDPYSTEVQELLKITNLRVNLTKLHTFGDNLLDQREELKEKYYYAMYEMVVRGSCMCYGHASRCIPVEGVQYDTEKMGMVDGQCQCQHNTWGTNCDRCLPLYNDRPWMPARAGQTNECKRCNCNNHARSCSFNEELWKATNYTTGGVCDDCMDNTEGNNCEKCKENFWRDPLKPIDDINTCRPCQCDKTGTVNGDIKCDPYTDETQGLVAGRCHCKPLVEGENCDRCKNGYFNLTLENPEGCEPCSCNLIGTTGNLGCDKLSGLCECKRFVTGRACDECMPGYFGLSADDPNGCKPCECSPGGSYDNTCDRETGQCKCKPNMTGRTCERPESGFYCPTLDHLLYEAEDAKKSDQRSQDYIRPIVSDYKPTWTGPGFVKVFEGATLEFEVDNIFKAGYYEMVIRYENSQSGETWEDLRIKIIRHDGAPDMTGVCADYAPHDDDKYTRLPGNANFQLVLPPVCLEPSKRYTIKLDFVRFNPAVQPRDAFILVDSILLLPNVQDLPALQGPDEQQLLEEFNYYRCKDSQLNIFKEDISPACTKFICNIGTHNDYALPCDCNPTGSVSNICDQFGGNCKCKPNVVGKKCDKCAPGTYEFGPNGCQPCNCNSAGAKNNFCDLETGQCDCYDKIEGAKCDKCMDNFWRFPSCEPCNCNGLADTCNQTTGICINCRDHTYGNNCENCEDGFYGNPKVGQACKECMCPGGLSGNQFAQTCYFDQRIDGVVCNCQEGYVGPRCDKCAVHYWGNPLVKGGTCTKCECNGNVDVNDPNSCDQATGQCKNCLYNTDGDNCEKCKPGFYGNALNHECRPCNCNPDGTEDHSTLNCDQTTGQCVCLANVIGKQCDQCKQDYYGLASGEGCSYCNCDTDGTIDNSTACNIFTGQCDCIDSRGGKTCSECSYGHWGNPEKECKKCQCSPNGSLSDQCDKLNGSCICRKGIRGHNCDTCDRGTTGEVPFCTPCGECFDDWTTILNDLENDLENLEERASNIAVASGSTITDFTSEYSLLESRLNDIKQIIPLNFTDRQLKALTELVQNINKQLELKKKSREKYYDIEKWSEDNLQTHLDSSRSKYFEVQKSTEDHFQQVMNLKESNEIGAEDSINKASIKSQEAANLMINLDKSLDNDLKPALDSLRQKIENSKENFEKSDSLLKDYLESVENNLTDALSGVFGLNQAVCGELTSEVNKCSTKCGGALCDGKCGTNTSSCSGLSDSYNALVNLRHNFDDLYAKQETSLKKILTKLRNSSNLLNNSNKEILQLISFANKSLEEVNSNHVDLSNLIETIDNFIKSNADKPAKIEQNIDYVNSKNIDLNESELEETLAKITELAARINFGDISKETEPSRQKSQEIIQKSEQAGSKLPNLLDRVNKTTLIVDEEENRNKQVEENVNNFVEQNSRTESEIQSSSENLNGVASAFGEIEKSLNELKNSVDLETNKEKLANILAKQESLKSKVKESGVTLERTKSSLDVLKSKLEEVTITFQKYIQNKDNNKNGAEVLDSLIALQSKILAKKTMLEQKASKIEKLQKNYDETRLRITELKSTINSLTSKAMIIKADILAKTKFFDSCS